ncbi:MAG: SpoIIIAH-like family protein [Bacilli bacterium]|nr:SpoIIIAH-like family protein [Bacilli bacterium]
MISKQNLWFLTLFSLILILGVYYITMPNDLLGKVENIIEDKETKEVVEEVEEESLLVAMRVNLEEERQETITNLQKDLTKENLTTEEKNNIYEQLKYLNEVQGKEEKLEKQIKKDLKLDCFIKQDNNNIEAVCISNEHDEKKANSIMRLIQEKYENKINITVKFQKK